MRILFTTILLLLILTSCQSQESQVDNTKPLYGEVKKNKEHKEIDKDFIQDCLNQFGSIDSSVNVQIDNAWRYFYNNDLETAMKRFNQAWLLNPEFPDSYFGFASLLEMQDKTKEANRFYKIGLEKDVKNERAEICYQRIADCKEQLNDIKGTIKAYDKITKINPRNSFAYKKIGYFQMQSKKAEEAILAYDKAIELDSKDAMTFNNRAYLNQTLGNYQLAIDDYSKAIELNPNYISSLVNRGITEMELNEFEKAQLDFEKCVVLDPKSGELWRFLGLAKLNLNKFPEACRDFRKALELGDKNVVQLIKENCEK
ncbi:tetratricopeptide repeat protein [Nonlabens sp. Ci31]|uniref:tetratricopeptide repeat protein n=1 Tax=Nonlabens sp. Ci31 TaxID=2608253 RepID=UPI001462B926|nr:tetratricopeptide repeat protein [Nonlabens sp. Ci31]QJP35431.1 tetratricopeptide repeat protein [Nonlabens sp. Ci31]